MDIPLNVPDKLMYVLLFKQDSGGGIQMNRALGAKFLKFGLVVGMGMVFSKTIAHDAPAHLPCRRKTSEINSHQHHKIYYIYGIKRGKILCLAAICAAY